MTGITGWETNGVTKLSALGDGRISLEFTGKDDDIRNVFIPAESVSNLVATLIAFCAEIQHTHDVGEVIEKSQNLSVREIGVGAAKDGSEFSLIVTTTDNLQLRFLLTPVTTEALAGGLIVTLAEHGRSPTPVQSEGPLH